MSRGRFSSSLSRLTRQGFCVATIACTGALSIAQEAAPPAAPVSFADQLSGEVRGVIDKTRGAICRVEGTDEHGALRGTGFFVDADGTLLTSFSVGGQSEDLVVTVGEEKYPATRRAADSRSGLAVLKVEAGEPLPFLKFGKSMEMGIGAPVIA